MAALYSVTMDPLAQASRTKRTQLTCRRLRAPKRSPVITVPGGQQYDAPLVSPGAELSGQPGSPTEPKPLFLLKPFINAALVKGSFKTIVAPPKYVDVNEWVAINRECARSSSEGVRRRRAAAEWRSFQGYGT